MLAILSRELLCLHGLRLGQELGTRTTTWCSKLRADAITTFNTRDFAREDGTTLNQFIVSAVAKKLAALKTADYFAERAVRADFRAFDRFDETS